MDIYQNQVHNFQKNLRGADLSQSTKHLRKYPTSSLYHVSTSPLLVPMINVKCKYWVRLSHAVRLRVHPFFFHRSLRDPSLETNVEKWNDCACHILLWLKILLKVFNARDSCYITRKHTCIGLIPKKGYRYSHGPVKEPVDLKNIHFIYQSFRTTTVVGAMFIWWLSTGDRGPCFSRIWLWSQPFFHANLSICSGTLSAVWWDNCPAHPANFAVNTMRASGLQVSSPQPKGAFC